MTGKCVSSGRVTEFFPRQRVRRRDGGADGALHHRDVFHLLQGDFARNRQRNVAVARLQRRADSRHRQLPHAQFNLRMMRPKRRNRPQQQLLLHRPGVGNRQRSRLTALRVRKRLYRLIALNQPLRHRHKRLPRLRQRRAGLAPLQQRQPQFRLQRRHLLAHRGLGDEALLRAEGDAARLRDGEEIREPLQFQGSPPSFLRDETTSFLILFPNENAPRCEVNFSFWLTGVKRSVAALR